EAGATVSLVSGPTALPTPHGVQRTDVMTAVQMQQAVMADIARQDIFIAVAAVADWRVAKPSQRKLKKSQDGIPQLTFEQNPDILSSVASLPDRDKPYCVGFAAESENLVEHAQAKRTRKNIPLLVGNIGPDTFGSDRNELLLFDEHGHRALGAGDKLALARQLMVEIARRLPD